MNFDTLFVEYDYEKEYAISKETSSKHLNKLMFLIICDNVPNRTETIVKYILENQNEINEQSETGCTPLMLVCASLWKYPLQENILLVTSLLDNGADIHIWDKNGSQALFTAVYYFHKYEDMEIIKLLLKYGAMVNTQNHHTMSILMIACKIASSSYHTAIIKLLIEHGANINLQSKSGYTALMFASRFSNSTSNLEIVKLLLDKGADVNILSAEKYNALAYAIFFCDATSNIDTVKLLLQYGANANSQVGPNQSILEMAIRQHPKLLKLLLKYGADPNFKDTRGWTPVMYLCENVKKDYIKKNIDLLIRYGADMNIINDCNESVLHIFVKYGRVFDIEIIRILLENGVNPYTVSDQNVIFLDLIKNTGYKLECLKIINNIEHHKLCMKKILLEIEKINK